MTGRRATLTSCTLTGVVGGDAVACTGTRRLPRRRGRGQDGDGDRPDADGRGGGELHAGVDDGDDDRGDHGEGADGDGDGGEQAVRRDDERDGQLHADGRLVAAMR